MIFLIAAIAFCASTIGAICGIGGGVIIKPVMDAFGVMDVSVINFLSGCTVLSMTCYSVIKAQRSGDSQIEFAIDTPLAIGAALGGLAGKELFGMVAKLFDNPNTAGAVQAGVLLLVVFGTLVYTLNKDKVPTKQVRNVLGCGVIGLVLGMSSAFLGIGGGPINLVVLFYFFSMPTKRAAQSSLYIILFSQATSTIASLASGGAAGVDIVMLAVMACCGILGGFAGRKVNSKIDDKAVDKLFIGLMVVIMGICVFNMFKYAMA